MRGGGFEETRCTWLTPGLFDLQVNGFAGVSFTDPAVKAADLGRADGLIRERGISRYCPTLPHLRPRNRLCRPGIAGRGHGKRHDARGLGHPCRRALDLP